jgi:hypothetical protein
MIQWFSEHPQSAVCPTFSGVSQHTVTYLLAPTVSGVSQHTVTYLLGYFAFVFNVLIEASKKATLRILVSYQLKQNARPWNRVLGHCISEQGWGMDWLRRPLDRT